MTMLQAKIKKTGRNFFLPAFELGLGPIKFHRVR